MIKKHILLLVIIGALFNLSSCVIKEDYQFMQPFENVEKIEFVIVHDTKNPDNKPLNQVLPEFTVLKELPDYEYPDLINDLKNIDFNRFFTDPGYMFSGDEAIKIIYSNGDYELINDSAQATYKNKKYTRTGHYCIEHEDYVKLKSNYFSD